MEPVVELKWEMAFSQKTCFRVLELHFLMVLATQKVRAFNALEVGAVVAHVLSRAVPRQLVLLKLIECSQLRACDASLLEGISNFA